jgi:hypothetical protein
MDRGAKPSKGSKIGQGVNPSNPLRHQEWYKDPSQPIPEETHEDSFNISNAHLEENCDKVVMSQEHTFGKGPVSGGDGMKPKKKTVKQPVEEMKKSK